MPAPAVSDYLQGRATDGRIWPKPGLFVQLVSNDDGVTQYVSAGATDPQGVYTINGVPSGVYTMYVGPSAIGPWTATGDTNYVVAEPASSQAIPYAANVTIDASAGRDVTIGTLTGNLTLANPTNAAKGRTLSVKLTQDNVGGRTLAVGTAWDLGLWTINLAPNAVSHLTVKYDGTTWRILSSLTQVVVALNVRDFGAKGDDATDDSAAIQKALSTGQGPIWLAPLPGGQPATYRANNLVLPSKQNQQIWGSPGVVLKKNANGALLTTPSAGWGTDLSILGLAIDCNGAAGFTGDGIAVGSSTAFLNILGGRIINANGGVCLNYTVDGAGAQGIVTCRMTVYNGQSGQANQNVACILLPNDVTQSSNREFIGIQTNSCILFDDRGSANSHYMGCVARNVILSNAPATWPQKLTLTGCRLATIGVDVALRGTQNSIVGNVFAGRMLIEGNATNGAYVGNVVAGDVQAQAGTVSNVIVGNRPSTGNVIDLGTNFVGASLLSDAGAMQAGHLFQGSGVPNNANGQNGDFYLRTDTPGTANQRLYVKAAGAWTGIV